MTNHHQGKANPHSSAPTLSFNPEKVGILTQEHLVSPMASAYQFPTWIVIKLYRSVA